MRMRALIVVAAAVAALAGSATDLRAEEWRLMGREGGCVELAEAAARRPLLRGIETPDQLVAELRRRGEEVRRQDIAQGGVTAVMVEAPGLGLGLVFVPPSLCR